jgi:hypothetical protein
VSGSLPVNDNERKIGQMVGDDNLDHGVTVATSRERMAAHRERRRKNLVQFTVAVAADELAKIARSGYPEVQSEDEKRAVEAISLFITDTLAARSARVTALRRATPFP